MQNCDLIKIIMFKTILICIQKYIVGKNYCLQKFPLKPVFGVGRGGAQNFADMSATIIFYAFPSYMPNINYNTASDNLFSNS